MTSCRRDIVPSDTSGLCDNPFNFHFRFQIVCDFQFLNKRDSKFSMANNDINSSIKQLFVHKIPHPLWILTVRNSHVYKVSFIRLFVNCKYSHHKLLFISLKKLSCFSGGFCVWSFILFVSFLHDFVSRFLSFSGIGLFIDLNLFERIYNFARFTFFGLRPLVPFCVIPFFISLFRINFLRSLQHCHLMQGILLFMSAYTITLVSVLSVFPSPFLVFRKKDLYLIITQKLTFMKSGGFSSFCCLIILLIYSCLQSPRFITVKPVFYDHWILQ